MANTGTGFDQILLKLLNAAEMGGHLLLECPFSALSFYLISKTSVLHPNLKFILLCQSACIFLRGFYRLLGLGLLCSVFQSSFCSDFPQLNQILSMSPILFRNFVAHVLVLERVMATVWARTYEKRRGAAFSCCWFLIVAALTLVNVLTSGQQSQFSLLNWLTFGSVLAAGIVEILVFGHLWKRNMRKYARKVAGYQHLSERYQLSENIRTTRQLMPSLFFHFLNLLIGASVTAISFYRPFSDKFAYDLAGQLTLTSVTFSNFFIELTTIIYHPFLKRKLCQLWPELKQKFSPANDRNGRVEPVTISTTVASARTLITMQGHTLIRAQELEGHFRMLDILWAVQRKPTQSMVK